MNHVTNAKRDSDDDEAKYHGGSDQQYPGNTFGVASHLNRIPQSQYIHRWDAAIARARRLPEQAEVLFMEPRNHCVYLVFGPLNNYLDTFIP